MRTQTLFTISSSVHALDNIQQYLVNAYKAPLDKMLLKVKQQLGEQIEMTSHPYRIGRVNYIKIRLKSEQGQFYVLLELSGYTEFPDIQHLSTRLHINVNDATDAYWFVQLLRHELCTPSVDNPV